MAMKIEGEVEKINGKEVSYSEFVERFMAKNKPVVLTGLMDHWRASSDWVTVNGKPNLPFFASNFGKSKVQVADCGARNCTDQKRVEMSVSEFVGKWVRKSAKLGGESSNRVARDESVMYLKDWHFVKEYPEYKAYTTPLFFCDDWINMYLDSYRMHEDPDVNLQVDEITCSDYRFVYMGEKGSWTPLHADVFMSYSWSANVCGRKHWLLLSPSQRHCIFDRNKNCVYNIFDDVNETKFPGFREAVWLECIQESNEIIFVPSGWHHQVHNLEDTISINHNWFNRHNLSWVWDLLLNDYNEAKWYIEDIKDTCEDFEGLCQRNLVANTGMNFYDFFIFLARISLANVIQVSYVLDEGPSTFSKLSPISMHLNESCVCIRNVAFCMKSMKGLTKNHGFHLDIRETLDDPRFLKLHTALLEANSMVTAGTYSAISPDSPNKEYGIEKPYIEKGSVSHDNRFLIDLRNLSSQVSTPEELVRFLDDALASSCKKFNLSDNPKLDML